jgi:hypothetical protein
MDTIRIDICYRPLRIGWAISAGEPGVEVRAGGASVHPRLPGCIVRGR